MGLDCQSFPGTDLQHRTNAKLAENEFSCWLVLSVLQFSILCFNYCFWWIGRDCCALWPESLCSCALLFEQNGDTVWELLNCWSSDFINDPWEGVHKHLTCSEVKAKLGQRIQFISISVLIRSKMFNPPGWFLKYRLIKTIDFILCIFSLNQLNAFSPGLFFFLVEWSTISPALNANQSEFAFWYICHAVWFTWAFSFGMIPVSVFYGAC